MAGSPHIASGGVFVTGTAGALFSDYHHCRRNAHVANQSLGQATSGRTGRSEEQQPQTHAAGHGFGAAVGIQFAQDASNVELDGMLANAQPLGDGAVGKTIGGQANV